MKFFLTLSLMVVFLCEASHSGSLPELPLHHDVAHQEAEERSLEETGFQTLDLQQSQEQLKEFMRKEMKVLLDEYFGEDSFENNQRTRRHDSSTDRGNRINGGSVYIRWGHRDCPSFSNKIYHGVAALPDHRSPGGGADQLCLPTSIDPSYHSPTPGVGAGRSFLYAVEYQTYALRAKLWHDIPCAVCEAPYRVSKMMVPARDECPSAWTLEYKGYIMAERDHGVHHRSLHICVDRSLSVVPGTSAHPSNNKEGLMNFVEARCNPSGGGIPCSPYVDGYEITCAVCTK